MSAIDYSEADLERMASTAHAKVLVREPPASRCSADAILRRVAREYHLDPKAILGRSKLAHIWRARRALYLALHAELSWGPRKIGEYVGRDRTTIVIGLRPERERRERHAPRLGVTLHADGGERGVTSTETPSPRQ